MRRLVYGNHQTLNRWMRARLPEGCWGTDGAPWQAIGVCDEAGTIMAVVAYGNHRPCPRGGEIEVALAADHPTWMNKGVVRALLCYPFVQLGCHRITALVGKRNRRARALGRALGFKEEGVVRQGFAHDDRVVMGLLRHEAPRWVGVCHEPV